MKKFLLLILFCLLGFASAYADTVSWELTSKEITTAPKAIMYLLDISKPDYISPYKEVKREILNYTSNKIKKVSKPQTFTVVGYGNLTRQVEFDTYIVSYKDKLYAIHKDYIDNNTVIDAVNNQRLINYKLHIHNYEVADRKLDSLLQEYIPIYEREYNHYKKLIRNMPRIVDSTKTAIKATYESLYQAEFDKWYNSLPKSTKNAYSKIEVTYSSLHSWNSAGGVNYSFWYTNKTNKTIKYCRVYGTLYNAVNDLVFCDITGDCTFCGTETGPIPPGAQGGGYWSNIMYDYAVDHIVVTSVNYTFMDGSTFTLSKADVERMLKWQDLEDAFYERNGRLNALLDKAELRLKNDQKIYEKEYRDMSKIVDFLKSGGRYNHLFDKSDKYYNFCENIRKDASDVSLKRKLIETFEKNNLIDNKYFK